VNNDATRPKATRTNYKKGLETRDKILTAAEESVFELGLHRASSREVVRRSGVTFGVIQHHFGTYEAVLLAVVERAAARLSVELSNVEVEEGTARDRLDQVAEIVWEYYRQPYYLSYLEIYMNLLRDPATTETTRGEIIRVNDEIERMWERLIVRLMGRKGTTAALRRLLFGTMRGLAVSRWLNDGRLDFKEERALFIDAIAGQLGI
jgi:AcrR family transcriptional regulator